MNGAELKARREALDLTQADVASRLKVTTATIRNWEAEPVAVLPQVQMLWEVWERRFRQESPHFGTVTLFYLSSPIFVQPDAPRSPLAPPGREWFPTNASAIARAGALWDEPGFQSPMIVQESGEILWTTNELERAFDGESRDEGAPTVPVMLRAIADYVRAYSTRYVRSGPRLPSPQEVEARRGEIEIEAGNLDRLAKEDARTATDSTGFERIHDRLNALGMYPVGQMVSGIYQAYVARRKPWPAP